LAFDPMGDVARELEERADLLPVHPGLAQRFRQTIEPRPFVHSNSSSQPDRRNLTILPAARSLRRARNSLLGTQSRNARMARRLAQAPRSRLGLRRTLMSRTVGYASLA